MSLFARYWIAAGLFVMFDDLFDTLVDPGGFHIFVGYSVRLCVDENKVNNWFESHTTYC